ncbi:MAG TPA: hypothetical protein DIW30_01875 [Bacteroidales bacterium]|nr:hypothetical protein [Bacteroidales bacterium]
MRYFTNNQYGDVIIVEMERLPKTMQATYTPLSDEQESFLSANPSATPMEVMQCGLNTAAPVAEQEMPLAEYKAIAREGMSELSLATSRKKVSDYQFLNAQSSLLVADGEGIYSHEQANEYIALYNTIGKQCRERYYTFAAMLESCETMEQATALVAETTEWYESI